MTEDDGMRVSVLVCTAGRTALFDRALTTLAQGGQKPDQLVIVNGGDADTNDVVAAHAHEFREVILVQYPNRNLSTSRNIGLPLCTGDIIATTDDDAEVAPDWIQEIKRAHIEDAGAGAVGGPVEGTHSESFLSRVADQVVFPVFPGRSIVRTLPGVNVAYKRAAVDAAGCFDEQLFRGEDVDFNWRIIRSGFHLVYDPAIRVRHAHRTSFRQLLQQQYMYGRAYVLVRRKWPDMYCVYPHRIQRLRDVLKLAHCLLAVLYQPALAATRMLAARDRIAAYPLLVVHHLVWKLGMARQVAAEYGRSPASAIERPSITLYRRWYAGDMSSQFDGFPTRVMSVPSVGEI